MKALLVEDASGKRSAIVLLPSGYIDRDAVGDPANIIVEMDEQENFSVRPLLRDEWERLQIIKEVNVKGDLLIRAIQFRDAKIIYERAKVELKDRLLNEMVTPNCDALTFLDFGSIIL